MNRLERRRLKKLRRRLNKRWSDNIALRYWRLHYKQYGPQATPDGRKLHCLWE